MRVFRSSVRHLLRRRQVRQATLEVLLALTFLVALWAPKAPGQNSAPPSTALEVRLLRELNRDRRQHQLSEVLSDPLASKVARLHAQELCQQGYLSHYNPLGQGPDLRYSQAGGQDCVMENIHMAEFHVADRPTLPSVLDPYVEDAQRQLMDSPGHRDNILAPEHTHVGLAVVADRDNGRLCIVQEFINRWVVLTPVPTRAEVGQAVTVTGRLLEGASSPVLNLTWQPLPRPMDMAALKASRSYQSRAEVFSASTLLRREDGSFRREVTLEHGGREGIYSIRVWVTVAGRDVLASDRLIEVRAPFQREGPQAGPSTP